MGIIVTNVLVCARGCVWHPALCHIHKIIF